MSERSFEFPRTLYKEFKKMSRDQKQTVLTDIYRQGADSVETASVDLDELRAAIGAINGIGEKRFEEIMAVVEKFISGDESK